MIRIYAVLSFLLIFAVNGISQEENFIRIVGNSEISFEAEGINISVDLKEIARDEYNKIRERSIEEIKGEFSANLKMLGFTNSDLEEVWPPQNYYGKQKQEKYTLKVSNKDQAREISNLQIKGVTLSGFKYSYPKDIPVNTEKLALDALEDAKRKATVLANKVNKKIGKVIRIVDMASSSKVSPPRYHDKENYAYNYKLTVTYELLD